MQHFLSYRKKHCTTVQKQVAYFFMLRKAESSGLPSCLVKTYNREQVVYNLYSSVLAPNFKMA